MADADNTSEVWKVIPSAPNYSASSRGRIRRDAGGPGARPGRILVQATNSTGRAQVTISRNGALKSEKVHRLVAEAFLGTAPDDFPLVCHRDGDPLCNRPENLYYGDAASNGWDASAHGTIARGSRNGNSKLTESQVGAILSDPRSASAIARDFGMHPSTVCRIKRGEGWAHIYAAR